jgi:hypothetical protein
LPSQSGILELIKNVPVNPQGDKLLEFGIVGRFTGSSAASCLPRTGCCTGLAHPMAPRFIGKQKFRFIVLLGLMDYKKIARISARLGRQFIGLWLPEANPLNGSAPSRSFI